MFLTGLAKMKKGLTLVEILVVILIIAILIVALVPRVTTALDKAKETQVRTDFRIFSLAAESVLREYAGFSGVPIMDAGGRTRGTISEKYWNKGEDIQEDATDSAVTQSLIKAINRYLETSYQFGIYVDQPDFGRSAALDPWKKPYEIYFVARDKSQGEDLNTDKIYITCNGKTQNPHYPDYSLLCEYYNGEVRTATAGFGETLPTSYTTFAGDVGGKQYVLLASLFREKTESSGLKAPVESPTPAPGKGTLFAMNSTETANKKRLFIAKIGELTSLEAVNAENADE